MPAETPSFFLFGESPDLPGVIRHVLRFAITTSSDFMMNSTDFDYIKGSEKPRDTGSVYQSKNSNSARPQLNVNVSAAYSYLSVLTREQGKLPDELASAQATLQRHIATLASDPQRAENANPVPQEKPLLELA